MSTLTSEARQIFTVDQILAMAVSGDIIGVVDSATKDHIGQYDPSQDVHPNFISLDNLLAQERVATRTFEIQLSDNVLDVEMQRSFAHCEPKRLGDRWTTSQEPTYKNYRELDVTYTGLLYAGIRNTDRWDRYMTYQIHQPGRLLHGLGVIVSSTMIHKHGVAPINREAGDELGEAVKAATRRLYTAAANTEGLEDAERYEMLANNASTQQTIKVDSFDPENGYRVLGVPGAYQLMDTIRLALAYGQENNR